MRASIRLALGASLAALLLASAVATSSANRLSISNRNFRIVWSPLIFDFVESIESPFSCSVTLEGSFHSTTITKMLRALLGHVSRASVSSCFFWFHNGAERVLGGATPATSLPWHVAHEGFSGTLPSIIGELLSLRGITLTFTGFGGLCLAVYGEANASLRLVANLNGSGVVIGTTPESSNQITRTTGGAFCPRAIRFIAPPAGTSGNRVTLLSTTTAISLRLI